MKWKKVLSTLLPLFLLPRKTRLNKFQPNTNRFSGPAIWHFSLFRAWSLLHEMHVVCQEGSSAYGKRTGHIGHTGLVSCSGLNISLEHDLDELFMVTSTMQHSHQSLRKQAPGV